MLKKHMQIIAKHFVNLISEIKPMSAFIRYK